MRKVLKLHPVRRARLAQGSLQRARGQPQPARCLLDRHCARRRELVPELLHDGEALARVVADRLDLREQVDSLLPLDAQPPERFLDVAEHAVGIREPRDVREPGHDGADQAIGAQLGLAHDVPAQGLAVGARVLEDERERRRLDQLEAAEVDEPPVGDHPGLEPDLTRAQQLAHVLDVRTPPRRKAEQGR